MENIRSRLSHKDKEKPSMLSSILISPRKHFSRNKTNKTETDLLGKEARPPLLRSNSKKKRKTKSECLQVDKSKPSIVITRTPKEPHITKRKSADCVNPPEKVVPRKQTSSSVLFHSESSISQASHLHPKKNRGKRWQSNSEINRSSELLETLEGYKTANLKKQEEENELLYETFNNQKSTREMKKHVETFLEENSQDLKDQRRKRAMGRLGSISDYSDLLSVDFLNYNSKSEDENEEYSCRRLESPDRVGLKGQYSSMYDRNRQLAHQNKILAESNRESCKILNLLEKAFVFIKQAETLSSVRQGIPKLEECVAKLANALVLDFTYKDNNATLSDTVNVSKTEKKRKQSKRKKDLFLSSTDSKHEDQEIRCVDQKQSPAVLRLQAAQKRGGGSAIVSRNISKEKIYPVMRSSSALQLPSWEISNRRVDFDTISNSDSATSIKELTQNESEKSQSSFTSIRSLVFMPASENRDEFKQILKSGKILAIFDWVTERSADPSDLEIFFLGFRAFISPLELLTHMKTKCEIADWSAESISLVLQTLLFWTKNYSSDFIDPKIHNYLQHLLLSKEMKGFADTTEIHKQLSARLAKRVAHVNTLENLLNLSMPETTRRPELLSINTTELARQLTLLEFSMFQAVNPLTLISSSSRENSPEIKSLIQRFNRVSNWVATEILLTANIKKRAATIKYFIIVAQALRELRNFNTLLEITAGLNFGAIQRLRKTWKMQLVPSKYVEMFNSLEDLMDCRSNFSRYRQTLQSCDTPTFPYFGIFLRDCTFIDVGNDNYVHEDFVNFEKMKMKGDVIRLFLRFQRSPYHFSLIPVLQNYLQNLSLFDEEVLQKYSTQYERAADI